jgi:hypothetical protein
MAKLRLQSQSPGEEERLGVGRPAGRCGLVEGRMADGAEELQRAHTALPSPIDRCAGLPHRRSFGCDAGEALPLLGQPMDGWEKGGAEDSVGERESGRADVGVVGSRLAQTGVGLRVRLGKGRRGDRGAGCACDRRGPAAVRRDSGAEYRRCRSIGRGRTGWSVVGGRRLDTGQWQWDCRGQMRENVEAVASSSGCTGRLSVWRDGPANHRAPRRLGNTNADGSRHF